MSNSSNSKKTKKSPMLNEKQKVFVQAYAAGQSAYDAACHAGYSHQNAKTTARRLLQNPEIQTALQNLQGVESEENEENEENKENKESVKTPDEAIINITEESDMASCRASKEFTSIMDSQDQDISPEAVVRELAAIGFTSMNDICSWSEDGVILHHSDDIPHMANAAIAEVRESGTARGGVLVKMHSKLRALEMLGRHLGMFSTASMNSVGQGLNSMAFDAAQALFDDENNALPEAILHKLNAVYGQHKIHGRETPLRRESAFDNATMQDNPDDMGDQEYGDDYDDKEYFDTPFNDCNAFN